jgi:hypothetical protein
MRGEVTMINDNSMETSDNRPKADLRDGSLDKSEKARKTKEKKNAVRTKVNHRARMLARADFRRATDVFFAWALEYEKGDNYPVFGHNARPDGEDFIPAPGYLSSFWMSKNVICLRNINRTLAKVNMATEKVYLSIC